jgi:hypothetical protein
MKLYEFFGSNLDMKKHDPTVMDREAKEQMLNDIFYYMIDHDDLHKKQFIDIAREIHKNPAKEHSPKIWIPLINKACIEFYKEMKMEGNPKDLFSKDLRKELCHKAADHYHKDIMMGEYNLGR